MLIELTELQQGHKRIVYIMINKIFYIREDPVNLITRVVSDGGAFIPVLESKEDIITKIKEVLKCHNPMVNSLTSE